MRELPGTAGEIEEEIEAPDLTSDDGNSGEEGPVVVGGRGDERDLNLDLLDDDGDESDSDDSDSDDSDSDEDDEDGRRDPLEERRRLLAAAAALSPSAAAAASLASRETEAAADAAADRRTALVGLAVALATLTSYQSLGARLATAAFLLASVASFLAASSGCERRRGPARRWYAGRARLAAAVGYRLSFAALAQVVVASGRGAGRGAAAGASSSAASFWAARAAPAMIPFFTLSARLGGRPRELAGVLAAYLAVVALMQPAACHGIEACWPRGREYFRAAAGALNRLAAVASGSVAVTAPAAGAGRSGGGGSESSPWGNDASSSSSCSAADAADAADATGSPPAAAAAAAAAGERACFDVMTFLFVSSAAASFVLERMYHHRSSCGGGSGKGGGRGRGRGVPPSPLGSSPPPSSSNSLSSLGRTEAATSSLAAVLLSMLLTWIALAVAGEVARSGGGGGAATTPAKPWLTQLLERHGQLPCAPA